MGEYFRKEFQLSMFSLEHENLSDFYISCWQRNRSCVPLLFLRTLIFLCSVAIVVTSLVIMTTEMRIGSWFIFMTHWGLLLILISSGFATAVSLVSYLKGPTASSLPLLVKMYWITFNCAITIAFFITAFYWTMLTDLVEDYAIDPVLDVFIHGINSVLVFLLIVLSRHPTRLLHFYLPLCFSIIYMIFSIIFYFAGGLSPFGTSWIYPMLDWSQPGQTILLVLGSAVLIIIIHCIVVGITLLRNVLTKWCRDTTVLTISNGRYN